MFSLRAVARVATRAAVRASVQAKVRAHTDMRQSVGDHEGRLAEVAEECKEDHPRSRSSVLTRLAPLPSVCHRCIQVPALSRAAPVAASSAVRSFRAVSVRRNDEMFADDAANYSYQQAAVTAPAPAWSCMALVDGEFKRISSADYKGKWQVNRTRMKLWPVVSALSSCLPLCPRVPLLSRAPRG